MKIPTLDRDPTRVLLVSRPLAPDRPDGTVRLVQTLAAAGGVETPEIRYRVLVPAGTPPPAPGVDARATSLPGALGDRGWQGPTLARLLAAPNHWIKHYFFTPTPRVVGLLRRIHSWRPGPTIQTLCSAPPPEADLRSLVVADHVIALSRHTGERLIHAGIPDHRVHTVPPAVPAFTPDPDRRRRVRRRLGLDESARLLLYLGDWDTAGAALRVATALPRLLDAPHRHAVLACRPKGADHARIARQARRHLAEGGAPAHRIHLLGTVPDGAELAAAADLALFPAERLPDKMDLPLALLESLAAGVPAVVADRGPLSDLVRAGAVVGVPAKDPHALVAASEALLGDDHRHRSQSEAARKWCQEQGSPTHLAREHARIYREVLQTP